MATKTTRKAAPAAKPKTTPETVEIGTEGAVLAAEFAELKRIAKETEAKLEAKKAAIFELLGDSRYGTVEGVRRIDIRPGTNSSIDRAKLKAAFPEAFELCAVTTGYRAIYVL